MDAGRGPLRLRSRRTLARTAAGPGRRGTGGGGGREAEEEEKVKRGGRDVQGEGRDAEEEKERREQWRRGEGD